MTLTQVHVMNLDPPTENVHVCNVYTHMDDIRCVLGAALAV